MRSTACTTPDHEQLKADPARWAELALIGSLETGPGDPVVELRNCPRCDSTLGLERPAEVAP